MKLTEIYKCYHAINNDGDQLLIKIFTDAATIIYEDVEWSLNHEQALLLSDELMENLENS